MSMSNFQNVCTYVRKLSVNYFVSKCQEMVTIRHCLQYTLIVGVLFKPLINSSPTTSTSIGTSIDR